ncbi:hypothetical protein GCK72_024333 [Caenorhabditis remanei]|uniref:BAAT/Acyl-CoA thioester hydrolase C-terminal domain-containing protein n=1 Tax=Caenorhabditis remanei TaxID=31234 RepID=A0A6A5FZ24_CAERE|nr:hypothetical protein GCK72_024333 [Caenorhabditis remanei]KAF1747867.1 hypothetical protein GCK72_024333 [Caenorhabditis remanei]
MLPEINVIPSDSLVHERISIVVNGLEFQKLYKIELRLIHKTGTYRSFGVFKASVSGRIDLRRDAPIRGTYCGVNERGLFESVEPTESVRYGGYFNCTPPVDFEYQLIVTDSQEQLVSKKVFKRRLRHPLVERIEIEETYPSDNDAHNGHEINKIETSSLLDQSRNPKITGSIFKPPGVGPFPTIIDISGTGGGLNEQKDAINYITSLPYTSERIGFQGVSFGGTLVMYLATKFPKIKAVCSINGSFAMDEFSHIRVNGERPPIGIFSPNGGHVRFLNDLMVYTDMVKNITLEDGAEFQFENSTKDTAFRFVSALDDLSVPTVRSTNRLSERLRKLGRIVDVDFVPGGHLLDPPCFPHHPMVYSNIAGLFQTYGGETSLHGKSEFEVWERTVKFFSEHLGAPTPLSDYLRLSAKL